MAKKGRKKKQRQRKRKERKKESHEVRERKEEAARKEGRKGWIYQEKKRNVDGVRFVRGAAVYIQPTCLPTILLTETKRRKEYRRPV